MHFTTLMVKVQLIAVFLLVLPDLSPAEIIVLQPSKDNTLYESNTGALSNGSGSSLFAGKTAANMIRRALLFFDVAGQIPAGSEINLATLNLTVTRSSSATESVLRVHPVTRDWGEGSSDAIGNEGSGATAASNDATWLHTFSPSARWANPGGDFAVSSSATTPVGGLATYAWSSAGLSADVQQWLNDPQSNFGWVVIGNEGGAGSAKRFASRENGDVGSRPRLTVDYTPPSGGTLQLTTNVNQSTFTGGETLDLNISASNPGLAESVDIYVVILLPDGNSLVNLTDFNGGFDFGGLSSLATLVPLVNALSLAEPFDVSLAPFFSHQWAGIEPVGTYTVFFVMADAGSLTDGSVDPGDLRQTATTSFSFAP